MTAVGYLLLWWQTRTRAQPVPTWRSWPCAHYPVVPWIDETAVRRAGERAELAVAERQRQRGKRTK